MIIIFFILLIIIHLIDIFLNAENYHVKTFKMLNVLSVLDLITLYNNSN